MMPSSSLVAVADTGARDYPPAPYSPSIAYEEFEGIDVAPEPNPVYHGVRELFLVLGLDQENAGTRRWNPLREVVRHGERVLIKPNLVRHYHPNGLDRSCIITHAAVLRAICDYVLLAGGPGARIVIADAPLQSCDFDEVVRAAGLDRLSEYYRSRGVDVEIRDLRLVRAVVEKSSLYGRVLVQTQNEGDPLGYTRIDLGSVSAHSQGQADARRYRVTCYDPERMSRHHGRGRHEYVVANTLLQADVVINVPKLKTHQKAGLTGALKNFIGINGHKDCLPHHTKGTPESGGDEYRVDSWVKRTDSWLLDAKERTGSRAARKAAAVVHRALEAVHRREGYWAGSWYGNETIARTTIDLNRIAFYATREGALADRSQRKILTICDAVCAGDEDGPLAPSPRRAGLVLAGFDPVAVDMAAARLMGFRYRAIPTLRIAIDGVGNFRLSSFVEHTVRVVSHSRRWHGLSLTEPGDSLHFRPHQGWKGHIEL